MSNTHESFSSPPAGHSAFDDIQRLRALARSGVNTAPTAQQPPIAPPTAALELLPGRHHVENKLLADALGQLEAQLSLLDGRSPAPAPDSKDAKPTGLVAQIEHLLADTTALRHRLVAAADRLQAILQGPATEVAS